MIRLMKRRGLPYGGARVETVALFPVTLHGVLEAGRVYRGFARNPISDDGLWLSLRDDNVTARVLDALDAYERSGADELASSWGAIKDLAGES